MPGARKRPDIARSIVPTEPLQFIGVKHACIVVMMAIVHKREEKDGKGWLG